MIDALRQLFARSSTRLPAVPAGERVYAIGDVHGRLDLFQALLRAVEADDTARDVAATTIVLLGDLIDRGPDSAGVIAAAREWQHRRAVRILAGNHEEMLLRSLEDADLFRHFLRYGGRELALSYGVDPQALDAADLAEAQAMTASAIPAEDLDFIRGFEEHVVIGDYLFVHAGIRPGVPLAKQRVEDLRWIREAFLTHPAPHTHMVVHGHSITVEPDLAGNRIGIDTGAYATGTLTALGLEGTDRWLIATREHADGIGTAMQAA